MSRRSTALQKRQSTELQHVPKTQAESVPTEEPIRAIPRKVQLPPADIVETHEEFWVLVDMPGVEANNFHLTVENNHLLVEGSGVRRKPTSPADDGNPVEMRVFRREFVLGEAVDQENIAAQYEEGILKIHLPKKEGYRTRKIHIK
ncbi:MAG: Hsp20/alpha crystallin family protein [Calditrichaeota bacterium]|nr:MAG: Hsp20/alpha crystallin family protein [Calditrichota bacterium]